MNRISRPGWNKTLRQGRLGVTIIGSVNGRDREKPSLKGDTAEGEELVAITLRIRGRRQSESSRERTYVRDVELESI